jgi:ketosteroid isomerase-like protein
MARPDLDPAPQTLASRPHRCEIAENCDHRQNHTVMSKAKKLVPTLGGSADDIEAAFYEALQTADIEKLMACWADEDEIVCVHPGGPRLVGMGAIRAAFDAMFSNGTIQAWPEGVCKVESLASSVHNVRERIEVLTDEGRREAFVIATNVYHNTTQGWRMVAHHASPGSQQEAPDRGQARPVLH